MTKMTHSLTRRAYIIKPRLIEQRRNLLADSIKEAREEYARGEVRRESVDDLMKEL